ncbi:hypothetical protein ACS0TY_029052 [Phlomoides rotata]
MFDKLRQLGVAAIHCAMNTCRLLNCVHFEFAMLHNFSKQYYIDVATFTTITWMKERLGYSYIFYQTPAIKNFWNTRLKKETKRLNCDVESEEFRQMMTARLRESAQASLTTPADPGDMWSEGAENLGIHLRKPDFEPQVISDPL